jgi:TatD DNase family protein
MWVDSHCHLQLTDQEPSVLLGRAPEVDWLVVPGIDTVSSRAALVLADRYPDRVVAAVGLHPHEADKWESERSSLVALAETAGAIGEIGLDFYRNLSPRDEQLKAFADQLHLAEDLDKPAIVHCRDAFSETHEIIESTGVGQRVVMHCWTGGSRWTRRFLKLGVMISFAGPLAFETGETIRGAAAVVPPERAMVETDTPYLAPPPYRGEPNEPSRVALVGAALARVWETTEEEVARVTSENARRMFRP